MPAPVDPAALRLLPELRRSVIALGVISTLRGVTTVAGVFALAALVTDVASGRVTPAPATALVALVAVRAALGVAGERVGAASAARVSAAVRRRVLAARLAHPTTGADAPEALRTLAVQGATSIEPYVVRFLPALVAAVVVPALALAALALTDPLSAAVVVCTLPLLPLFAALVGAGTRDAIDRRWRALTDLAGHYRDGVLGLPTLIAYGRARRRTDAVAAVGQRHRAATMRTLRLAFLSSVALELLATICVAIVAVFVGIRLAAGGLDLRTGLTAILLAPEAYWPIRRVGSEFHSAADGAAALRTATELLSPPKLPATAGRPGAAAVRARSLTYRYPGRDHDALSGLDLDAGVGLTVVTGPSGAGKTTLLELLAGLRTPTAGEVRAGRAHLVLQRPLLTAGSVRENLTLSRSAPDAELWTALRALALDDVVACLPAGLDTLLGEDGGTLSAGQRSRLALARALVDDAPVILLDEPTAHLDAVSAAAVHAAVTELARTRCVIAVTHRGELAGLTTQRVELGLAVAVPA